ncbi:MAG: hypothetical protein AB7F40_02870 [Victivallaceae bacterium]|nr:hypothetical protein [Victivallaceae bacterium]
MDVNGVSAASLESSILLRPLIARFCSWLDRGMVCVNGEWTLPDPYESDYSENYASANAAAVYAAAMNFSSSPQLRENYRRMMRRSAARAAGLEPNPFCRTFLVHYSLLGLLMLPEEERGAAVEEFLPPLREVRDVCDMINVNCAAMQLSTRLMFAALGAADGDESGLFRYIDFIQAAQLPDGFINDSIGEKTGVKDLMPIAYHGFILFILGCGLVFARRHGVLPAGIDRAITAVMARGMAWMRRVFSPDGGFAMCGRSRYQMFTWGVHAALAAMTAAPEPALCAIVNRYRQYEKEDGSYSCTPNFLPHGFRTGFECYTHVNMYNCLGFTGLALAAVLTGGGDMPFGFPPPLADGGVIDPAAGYAFFRRGGCYFGVSLRDHDAGYTPAMAGFHYLMGPSRLPLAENRMEGASPLLEGFATADGEALRRASITANVQAKIIPDGLSFEFITGLGCGRKSIEIYPGRIVWSYELHAADPAAVVFHTLPLVVSDGKNTLSLRRLGESALELSFAGCVYRLACSGGRHTALSLRRSLESVSGLASEAVSEIAPGTEPGVFRWSVELRMLSALGR